MYVKWTEWANHAWLFVQRSCLRKARPRPGIYVFHTWSICARRKTSTIGLFELCIIIICWIFCAYTQMLDRDVEVFCVPLQKFLIVVHLYWITKSSNAGLFAHIRKSLIDTWKFLSTCTETPKFITICIFPFRYVEVFCAPLLLVFECLQMLQILRDVEFFCEHVQKFLMVILDSKVFQLWIICANTQNLCHGFFAYAQKFQITICIIPYSYVEVCAPLLDFVG